MSCLRSPMASSPKVATQTRLVNGTSAHISAFIRPLKPLRTPITRRSNTRLTPCATKRASNGASASSSRHSTASGGGFKSSKQLQKGDPQGEIALHEHQADLVRRRYFEELFTGGDYTLAPKILHSNISHKDMVRDEQYQGIDEIVEYMRRVKQAYPGFIVRASDIAPASDGRSMFVAFEGHAAEGMPLFSGIDRFYFDEEGEKIVEVNVYRSNWQGAKGHEARKAEMESNLRKEVEMENKRKTWER